VKFSRSKYKTKVLTFGRKLHTVWLDFRLTVLTEVKSLFGWLVADGWCWFVLREEYCWLVAGG
jgi:hypothetical protein